MAVAGRIGGQRGFEDGDLRLGEKCSLGQLLMKVSLNGCLREEWLS